MLKPFLIKKLFKLALNCDRRGYRHTSHDCAIIVLSTVTPFKIPMQYFIKWMENQTKLKIIKYNVYYVP